MLKLEVALEINKAILEFNDISMRFRDFRPVMHGRMDKVVREFFRRRFLTNGHGEWQPLSPTYRSYKRRQNAKQRILQFTGSMMEAFTTLSSPHSILVLEDNLYVRTVDEEIGPRARGHQRGYSPAQPRLPQRRIVPDTPEDYPPDFMETLRDIVRNYVIRGDR